MPPRRGQGRGYGGPSGRDYEEEGGSTFSGGEGHAAWRQQQQHHHHQEPHRGGIAGGGRGSWQHQGFLGDRGDRAGGWRGRGRAGRGAEWDAGQRASSQDWRSEAGILSTAGRTGGPDFKGSYDYGGRRGEDQGGGGGSYDYGGRRGEDQGGGGGSYDYGGRRGEDQWGGSGYGYGGKRGEVQGGGGVSYGYGGRRREDGGGGGGSYGGTRGGDQGRGGQSYVAMGVSGQAAGGDRGRKGGAAREEGQNVSSERAYGRRRGSYTESEAGGNSRTGSYGGRGGRRGGGLSTGGYQPQGSWASPAPPLEELLPGFHGLLIQEETAHPLALPAEEEIMSPIFAFGESSLKKTEEESAVPLSSSLSYLNLVAPNRPHAGKRGQAITVWANHFKVIFHPRDNIYQYDVDISPKISSKGVERILVHQLVDAYRYEFNGKLPVHDGGKSMYTHGPLPFEHREFVVTLLKDKEMSGGEKKFTLTIRHVSTLNRQNLEDFLRGKQVPTPQEHLQALDVLLREHPALHFIPVSRSFFKSELGSVPLEGGLVALNGFYQSLRPTEDGLQLNIDLSTTAFHASIPVIDFLRQQLRNFDPCSRLTDMVRMKVKKALARLKVQVIHRQTPRRYRISDLSTGPTKDLKFPMEGTEDMRVVDYFKRTYNYVIEYLELPCLQVQANKTSYLPMEVCVICDGQKYGSKLNERQTTSLRELACVLPRVREARIRSIMNKDDGPGRGEHVGNFGVQVVSELTVVNARLLPPPKLRYGNQGKVREILPNLGAWNLMNSCVVEGGTVAYWALISFDQIVNVRMAADFVFSLSRRCNELGVRMAGQTIVPPLLLRLEDLESSRLEKYLRLVHDQASQAIHTINQGEAGQLQLLVCVMAEKHSAYGELKKICETQIGIVTQCCLSKHVRQCKSQYLANLALKVNAKVGGRNVTLALELPLMCPVFNRPTIIFGADVTHPPPGDDAGPSIAAVVANVDWPSANRYIARVRAQAHREEIIQNLREMVQELWREFCEKTKSRPDRVIMFRDGVSEGQFDEVLQKEVVVLKEAFEEVGGPDYSPLITWAVVQKRHHTRLFPADRYKDKNNNILPGTVVDSIITHPREFDFFLCSHAGIQGTSRPTHYHVLWDENNFKSDDLQELVYNLCYTYARCTRAVSVVPPAYYAHLAAYRARLYLDLQDSDTATLRGVRSRTSSSGGGGSSRAAAPAVPLLPRVRRNVQEVMYFC